jgi:hypothetical protein
MCQSRRLVNPEEGGLACDIDEVVPHQFGEA